MPYTIDKPPDWAKNLPEGAVKIAVETFNAVLAETKDEKKARTAAWSNVKEKYEKGKDGEWRARGDMSLDKLWDMLWSAVQNKWSEHCYVYEVFPSYLIFNRDGKYYKVSYGLVGGEVQFGGEETEMEQSWIERAKNGGSDERVELSSRLIQARDPEGAVWDVVICEPGLSKHMEPWFLDEEVLREAASFFEGTDVNLYELPDATHVPDPLFDVKSLLVKNKAGWIDKVRYVAGEGLRGVLHFLDSAAWIGKNLVRAMQGGERVYGLSYDAPVKARMEEMEGRVVRRVTKFLGVDSVDIVTRPAAGGKFIRAVASRQAQNHQGRRIMNREELLKLLQEKRPDLLEGKDANALTDEEITGLARMAMEPPKKADPPPAKDDPPGDGGKFVDENEFRKFRCEMDLERTLAGSGLPEHAVKRLRSDFKDRIFEADELTRAVNDMKDFLAAVEKASRKDDPVPAGGIGLGLGSFERIQMAADRMLGLTLEDMKWAKKHTRLDHRPFFEDLEARSMQDLEAFDEVPAFQSIREMYTYLTGDPEVSGRFYRSRLPAELRARADITSATFTYVLGNTLGRRLVRAYRQMNFHTDVLISIRKPVRDFRQQEAVLVGGFPDIADVDPEAADYQEIAGVTDEESTYTLGQKGNLLTITRKTIINDDILLITRLVDAFGRAFARTHGQYVWNFFVNNSNCSDATAWFTSGHGNLGSSALSHSTAKTAWLFLAKTTEKDNSKRIGLLDGVDVKPNLVHPPDIFDLAGRVANEEFYYSSNDLTTKLPNPLYKRVNPVQVTLLTDTADWGLLMPPSVIDMIEMGYLNGNEEPEFFVADMPQSEQVFVADKIRHKGRHEYAGAVIDYRSGYKAEV